MKRLLNKIGLTTWKRRVAALVIALPVVSVPTVEITSHSRFCNSCHIMEPYYTSWKHGSHKDVECVKCHIAPGVTNFVAAKLNGLGQVVDDVLHRTSMKPSASVRQVSCLRSGCHDVERLKTASTTSGKFLFNHGKHLEKEVDGITIGCSTCHSHVKGDQHFEINTNACITCHMLQGGPHDEKLDEKSSLALTVRGARSGGDPHATLVVNAAGPAPLEAAPPAVHKLTPPANCTACHVPPAGTLTRGELKINHADYLAYGAACESCHRNTTATPPPVESGQCFECHTFGIERFTNSTDMHKVHNEGEHKVECFSCHGAVHHGLKAQAAALDKFDCRKCHTDQHGVQRRNYIEESKNAAGESAPAVSPMFLAHVDCTGCHIKQRPLGIKPTSGATVAVATPEACDACHKPGFGKSMIPLWQKAAHSLYEQTESDLAAATPRATTDAQRTALADARRALDAVRADGSWGVHNPRYTQQLLEQARAKLNPMKSPPAAPTPPQPPGDNKEEPKR